MVHPGPRFVGYGAPLAIAAVLVAAIWAVTLIALGQLRRSTEDDAASMRQNLANTLAEREASSVRAIDISLTALREAWVREPRSFDRVVAQHEGLLRRERVIQTAVVDADGWLLYSRLPWPGRLNFADRGYFQAQRDNAAQDRIRVSEPLMGRVTHEWAIQFTRPILVNGRFAGLVVVAVPPPALEEVYREIDLGPDGVVTLARKDGQILARSNRLPESLHASLVPPRSLTASSGHFMGHGQVDGVARAMTWREVDDYGLVMFVGQSLPAVLAPYVRLRNYLLTFAGGASALVLCIAVLVALRRRDEARYRAAQERMMLELHDGCIQAIYAVGLGLQGTRRLVREAPDRADSAIAQAEADLNLVIQELRAFIGAQKPERLGPAQLLAEVERALPRAGHTQFDVDLQPAALVALDAEQAIHVLRIIREAAANVQRHANATRARIYLAQQDGEFRLDITDDGGGIVAGGSTTGLGLAHIEARARKLRGRAEIAAAQAGGTRVSVRFPCRP